MNKWLDKDEQFVWHPFTQMFNAPQPLEIIKAEGSVLYDAQGKSYLDCNSSWWVNVHGHGNKHLREAINRQFEKVDHVIFAGATHHRAIELAERLVGLLPQSLEKVFFSDDGSAAVEVAMKMAFQYWFNRNITKKRIVALDGAYHGDTFGAMAVGQRGYFNEPFEHFFFDVDYLPFPMEENQAEIIKRADELFKTNEIAALIVEPLVQGSAGMRMYEAAFLDELMRLARKFDVIVIFDEVMTAWGRTGKYFAMDHCVEKPDIVCLSKGLTGGVLPLGLTVASREVYNAFLSPDKTKALLHGHSFTGNPLACAAACASLDLFELPETWERIESISKQHSLFREHIEGETLVKEIRQLGTILAIEINTGEGNTYFSEIRDVAYTFFLENGLLLRPLGNVLFLNPPYSTSDAQLQMMYDVLSEFICSLKKE